MEIVDLLNRIEEAAEEDGSIVYLDTNIIDMTTNTRKEQPVKYRENGLEEIARWHINCLESVQRVIEKMRTAQQVYALLRKYPNIFAINQVVKELERGQEWANYVISTCNRKTERGCTHTTRKGKTWKRHSRRGKEPFDEESTAQIDLLKSSTNILWGTLESIRKHAENNQQQPYTEKQLKIYKEVLDIFTPGMSRQCPSGMGKTTPINPIIQLTHYFSLIGWLTNKKLYIF